MEKEVEGMCPEVRAAGCPVRVRGSVFCRRLSVASDSVIDLLSLAFPGKGGILVENTPQGEWEALRPSHLVAPCAGIGRPGFLFPPGCDWQVTGCLTCLLFIIIF